MKLKSKIKKITTKIKAKTTAKTTPKTSSYARLDDLDSSRESSSDEPERQRKTRRDTVTRTKTSGYARLDDSDSSLESSSDEPERQQKTKRDTVISIKSTTQQGKGNVGGKTRGAASNADPPKFGVSHYTITLDQVANATGATKVHAEGITGKGVHVAIIDSGYFPHAYFQKKYPNAKIQVTRVPVSRWSGDVLLPDGNEGEDLNGHGTAMVANVLAMAPDAEITMIVCKSDLTALEHAFSLNPDVISVSRGPTYGLGKGASNDSVARSDLIDSYKAIIDDGKKGLDPEPILLDAVGNIGARGILSLLPDVISVGGTYMDEEGKLAASGYTNAYTLPSDIYKTPAERGVKDGAKVNFVTKTQLPDITGLCGTEEHPDYLALPTQPGSELELQGTPGWGLASGSSCATPQVAGACALLKQVNRNLTAAEALSTLRETGKVVTEGRGHVDEVDKRIGNVKDPSQGESGLIADGGWSRLIDVEAAVRKLQDQPPRPVILGSQSLDKANTTTTSISTSNNSSPTANGQTIRNNNGPITNNTSTTPNQSVQPVWSEQEENEAAARQLLGGDLPEGVTPGDLQNALAIYREREKQIFKQILDGVMEVSSESL